VDDHKEVRFRTLPGRLAEIVVSEERWSDALACLAAAVHADVAVAITPQALLGVFGLVPSEALRAENPDELSRALIRAGLESTWVHRCPQGLVAVATRSPEGFGRDERELLEEVIPVLSLGLDRSAARAQIAANQATRRKLETRLTEVERQSTVGAVASAVAHDLSAPISALMMEIGAMRDRVRELGILLPEAGPILRNVIEDLRGLADHCLDSTERARQLLIDFRLAAHPFSEKPITSNTVNVGDALRACVRMISPLARDKVRLELTVEPGLPVVAGNRRRLEQAFTNLLMNGLQAAAVREGLAGVVEARLRRVDGDLVVEIADNGPGIPIEHRDRIFDPFFTTKAPESGTGLGLPIARDAVEANGGRIEVESERGRGACFRIRLPIAAAPAQASPTSVRKRVMVVDDDEAVLRAMERILRTDYDVTALPGGLQVLEMLGTGNTFDALIIDLAMPEMDGPELYERIKQRWPGLERKIVFATGGAFTSNTRAFLARVPNSRFEKPITREELRPIVLGIVNVA
jgi:two-component system, cell cycle sensor histidine kinase and response regulator CckA